MSWRKGGKTKENGATAEVVESMHPNVIHKIYAAAFKTYVNMIQKKYSKTMINSFLLFFMLCLGCREESTITFSNKQLEKEVRIYLKDLKKNSVNIPSIVFATRKKEDSVFITISNTYPILEKVNSYANYKGIYFCFTGHYPLLEYFEVTNPESVPEVVKKASDDVDKGVPIGHYEPFTKYLTFYEGRLVESMVANRE